MSKKIIKIDHELAKNKIATQHDLGVNLARSGIELVNKGKNNSRSDVDDLKIDYEHWHDITSEILNEIFLSPDYSYKFRKQKSSKVENVSSRWQPDIQYYLNKEIKPKIVYLKLLVENIHDFDEVDSEPKPEPDKTTMNTTDSHMPLKERIENNLVIWLLGVLLAGFLAGIGAYKGILEIAKLEVIPKQELLQLKSKQNTGNEKPKSLATSIERQVEVLTAAHHQRLTELQKQLLSEEKAADDHTNPDSWRKPHRESAQRIEQLIANEHKTYNDNLKSLKALK